MALVNKYYIYSDPSGDPYASRCRCGFKLPEDATADVLLGMIMDKDPPPFKKRRRSLSDLRLYKSKDALHQDDFLDHDASLSGLGTRSEPILVVPWISTETMVVLERVRHEGKDRQYEMLGRRMCNLICNHLNAGELRKFAASASKDPSRGFFLRDMYGYKVPLLEETAAGLYKCAVNEAYYHHDHDESGDRSSCRCLHVIVVDDECYDEKVQLSSGRVAHLFPFDNVESKIFEGGDLLKVFESLPPPAISREQLISAAELLLYTIGRFQGLQKEQLARTIASTMLYTAMQLVVLDAEGRAAQTGGLAQRAVASGGRGEEKGKGACASGGGEERQEDEPDSISDKEGGVGTDDHSRGSGGSSCAAGLTCAFTATGGGGTAATEAHLVSNCSQPLNDRVMRRRARSLQCMSREVEAAAAAAAAAAEHGRIEHRASCPLSLDVQPQLHMSASLVREQSSAATASPHVERPVSVGAATARRLVMVEEMPVQPGTVLEINRKRVCITGSHDYVVAHVAPGEVVDNASCEGGLVVIEVKRPDKFEESQSFSQAIAGAAAIHHNRKSQGRGLDGSGGPLHVVKTDGRRWQCGRVMEKIGQCPDVLLGQVVTLNFSGDWPVNVREVVNYLGKVLRESLKTSPRVSEESVLSGARSSGVM